MRDPMDYIYYTISGGLPAFDMLTLLALLIVSTIYLLAPVVGYSGSSRGAIYASLWLLLAKMCMTLLKWSIIFIEIVDNKSSSYSGNKIGTPAMLMLFFLMESALFVLAMVLFVCGLGGLRRQPLSSQPMRRDLHED